MVVKGGGKASHHLPALDQKSSALEPWSSSYRPHGLNEKRSFVTRWRESVGCFVKRPPKKGAISKRDSFTIAALGGFKLVVIRMKMSKRCSILFWQNFVRTCDGQAYLKALMVCHPKLLRQSPAQPDWLSMMRPDSNLIVEPKDLRSPPKWQVQVALMMEKN